MNQLIMMFLLSLSIQVNAQELFVMTEPASNMPTGSVGLRTMNSFMFEEDGKLNYHLMPELMWGVSAKWMMHLQSFHSNRNDGGLKTEGGSAYAKYRLLSSDDLHKHFRLAVYGRYSINKADIHQQEIETMGHNTGYEGGLVATQLINKVAVSVSSSYERALNNHPKYDFPTNESNNATNYTFSAGRLMYPKKYTSYKQTNINAMIEILGQHLNANGKSYMDIVPAVQFIINSQARIDLAYRKEIYSTMSRTAPNGFMVKFEYTLFNVTQ